MKRVLLSLTATVLGLVALLSFKTHGHAIAGAGSLPTVSAADPAASQRAGSGGTTSSAPPDPSIGRGSSSTSSAAQATPKKYLGSAVQTRYGIVQVEVRVTRQHIASVSFVQLSAFDDRSAQINSQAAPILLQETIAAQSAQIDTVSGASYTSDGYVQSLQSALDAAGIR